MRSLGAAILVVAALTLALALPASANSTDGSYTSTVSGVLNTNVQGNFVFNTGTDTFTGTLMFNGAFNGVNENFSQKATCAQSICTLNLTTKVDGDTLTYTILLNLISGQYSADGTISNLKSKGAFADTAQCMAPEGGSTFLYLGLAAFVMFSAFFLAGSRTSRNKSAATQSVLS